MRQFSGDEVERQHREDAQQRAGQAQYNHAPAQQPYRQRRQGGVERLLPKILRKIDSRLTRQNALAQSRVLQFIVGGTGRGPVQSDQAQQGRYQQEQG